MIKDRDKAAVRLRPHWGQTSRLEQEVNELTLKDVIEFHADGTLSYRSGSGSKTDGTWRRETDRVLADVKPAGVGMNGSVQRVTVAFVVEEARLFVVSFGEEIELERTRDEVR